MDNNYRLWRMLVRQFGVTRATSKVRFLIVRLQMARAAAAGTAVRDSH